MTAAVDDPICWEESENILWHAQHKRVEQSSALGSQEETQNTMT